MNVAKHIWNRFKLDNSGSMATMFAIGSTVLLMIAGAAIEVTSLTKAVTNLQDAADSAVLAAAVSGDEFNEQKLKALATDLAESNLVDNFNLSLDRTDSEVLVEITADYQTIVMGIFGYKTRPISVQSGSAFGTGGKLNLALALDTTLSMEGGRMSSMIDAATHLLELMEETDSGKGNVKIGVVPFADYVRLDTAFGGEDWIDVEADHYSSWDVLDEANSVNCTTTGSGESEVTNCEVPVYETKTALITWVGCMASRPDGNHKTAAFDDKPFKGAAGRTTCNSQNNVITPLTDDFSKVENDLKSLTAKGKTYLPVGLLWAWRALEEESLFTDEKLDEDEPTQKVLLLMTDGSNTASINGTPVSGDWDGVYHYGSYNEDQNREAADALTVEMCNDIKNADIRLVTVAYEVDDADTKSMLKSCASTGADFHDARDAAKLLQAFGKIGSGFKKVRLTL